MRDWNKPRWMLLLTTGAICAGLALANETASEAKEEASKEKAFLRVRHDEDGGRAVGMDTAIVTYVPKNASDTFGLEVELVGAVHLGDRAYYERLNEEFEGYDVLLYELVAPEGTVVPKGGGRRTSSNPLSMLQNGLSSFLELEHQLHHVDYTKDNFVHADMSPSEFAKSMEDKGESIFSMYFRMVGVGLAMQSSNPGKASPDAALLAAFFSKNRALALKRVFAEQFESVDWVMNAFEGDQGSTIIAERNKRALAELTKQVETGKKKIGIFYGAGHLPDMERRLLSDFGLKRQKTRWVTAWNLSLDD